jgi:hypothetical protein
VKTTDLYDPINDAPFAKFEDPGDNYRGTPVRYETQNDKYNNSEQVLVATFRLAKPTAGGDDYAKLVLRSEQLRREYGRQTHRAGRADFDDGLGRDQASVTYVEHRETSGGGSTFKWYEVEYKADVGDVEVIGDVFIGSDAGQPVF